MGDGEGRRSGGQRQNQALWKHTRATYRSSGVKLKIAVYINNAFPPLRYDAPMVQRP